MQPLRTHATSASGDQGHAALPASASFLRASAGEPIPTLASASKVSLATLTAYLTPYYGETDAHLPAPRERSLDFVEVFAGEQSVSRGLRAMGYVGVALDQRYDAAHNVLCPIGFLTLLHAVLHLKPGGLLWAAPPCSSWVFLSRASSGRHLDVRGDPTSAYIRARASLRARLAPLARPARRVS